MAAYLILVVLGYLGICFYLAGQYISPLRWRGERPPEFAEVEVSGAPTWVSPELVAGNPRKGIFVLCHGYGGSRNSWRTLALRLQQDGYAVIVPALPAHDANPDPTCGFGRKEAEVVLACYSWAKAQSSSHPSKVIGVGVSMGGAAVWLASERGAEFDAIVSDSAFAQFDEATENWFRSLFWGANVVLSPVRKIAQFKTGLDPASIRPIDAARHWKGKPSLILHGDRDRRIPLQDAKRLAEASGGNLWIVPNCGHAEASSVALEEYAHRVDGLCP